MARSQRNIATSGNKIAHSHTIELEGASHSVYESRPKEVAAQIEKAAQHANELHRRRS